MKRSSNFTWAVCVLLVTAVTGLILWRASHENVRLLSDDLVTRTVPTHHAGTGNLPNTSAAAVATEDAHALDPALRLARDALTKFRADVDDYTATMIKRERIAGALGGEMRMEVKVRTRKVSGDKVVRPLHAYLKVLDPWLARGREVIWVEGRNEGKLVAHEGGLKNLVRISLGPTDRMAMMGNKYPITEIGLEKLIEKLIEKGERDKLVGPCEVTITSGYEVGGRPCQLVEVQHPDPDPRFDFHIARIYLDEERMIPLRYAAFLWPEQPGGPPVLEEEYTYTNVKLNVGLQDKDFDTENPAYNFP